MSPKGTYFAPTTPQQRKLLFELWEATGKVTEACRKAHVGRTTFYYWKPGFEAEGYAGLEEYKPKGAPKGSGQTSPEIEGRVIQMKCENKNWGKHRIADEMAKENNWKRVVSPNTVKRILADAGLWHTEDEQRKKAPSKR
jgi:hypothetical protein